MTPSDADRLHKALIARGVVKPPEPVSGTANDNEYDSDDDIRKSFEFCYDVIRRRMQRGGPGWEPK